MRTLELLMACTAPSAINRAALPTLNRAAPLNALPAQPNRRAALLSAAAALAAAPSPALASSGDGKWAQHTGPFDDDFFAGFTVSKVGPDFVYQFVEEGESVNVQFRVRVV